MARAALPLALLLAASGAASAAQVTGPGVPQVPALSATLSGRPALPATGPELPGFATVADPADRDWFSHVFYEAAASRTARAVFQRVQATTARLGRPVVLETARAGFESFNYDWDVVTLRSKLQRHEPRFAAATLVHELLHFVQKATRLPVDMLELELEAYVADMRVSKELGAEPPKSKWDRDVRKRFAEGPEAFIAWLQKDLYKDSILLTRGRTRDYAAELQSQAAKGRKRMKRLSLRIIEREAVLADMRRTGQTQAAIENYHADVIAPLEARLRSERIVQEWARRDLEILRDPGERDRVRAYARGVMRKLKRLHDSLSRR